MLKKWSAVPNSSRSESAVGRLSVASIYGIGCQQCIVNGSTY